MKPSAEYLKIREPFITEDLHFFISKQLNADADFFTLEKDYPKAFRVGECEAASPDKTVFQVLLFWKDDTRSEQKAIRVEAVRDNGVWLIKSVYVN
jgi:hypothetical protein